MRNRRHAGEKETYSPNILAQEVAGLLSQAMEHTAQLGGWRHQEAFVLSIHGTHLKLTAAYFTAPNTSLIPNPLSLRVRWTSAPIQ
jgi:hypothetical protein